MLGHTGDEVTRPPGHPKGSDLEALSASGLSSAVLIATLRFDPSYSVAGASVGQYTGRVVTSGMAAGLNFTMSTQGEIDRFAASAVSGEYDSELTLSAASESLVAAYLSGEGWDTTFEDHDDGTTTMTATRTQTGSRLKQKYKVRYNREQE